MSKTRSWDGFAGLAKQINSSHSEFLHSMRTSVGHARHTGSLLIEAKEKVEAAGERWLEWVEDLCDFSIAEAQRYMRIANHYNIGWNWNVIGDVVVGAFSPTFQGASHVQDRTLPCRESGHGAWTP
jgi:hypothetical protein